MLASKNITAARLNEAIEILQAVGLPKNDPFGFRGQIQRHNFDNGALEYTAEAAGVRFIVRKAAGADQITNIEVVADHHRVIPQEDIEFANEDLADLLP